MTQDEMKKATAIAAIEYLESSIELGIIGVGTGSTANHFIDALAKIKHKIDGAVASSEATAQRLKSHGIAVLDLNSVGEMPVYVDGADEITEHMHMIKGGGGALTREKIVAACARKFVCIADESKLVGMLGKFPLPVEVIPMARLREGFTTDNGNVILDVHNMEIMNPVELETAINQITGVVTNGLFARSPADVFLMGTPHGVTVIRPH